MVRVAFDGAVLQQHDVVRLDVAVDDAVLMRVLESLQYLRGEVDGLFPVEHLLHIYILFEGDAVDVLHDDILDHITEADVVYAHDVGVIEHGDSLALVLEAAYKVLVIQKLVL